MGALASDKFRASACRRERSHTDGFDIKTQRDSDLFKMHADERAAYVKSGVGAYFFDGNRVVKVFKSSCCKATACFWFGNNTNKYNYIYICK